MMLSSPALAEQLQHEKETCAQICACDGECVTLAARAQMIKLALDTVDLVIALAVDEAM